MSGTGGGSTPEPNESVELQQPGLQDPAVEKFAKQITGASAEEVNAVLADRIRLRRADAQFRILKRAQEEAAAAGYEPQAVPMNVLVPLLEAGSLDDDGTMAERWAALLANASRPGGASEVPPSFPEVLRQLSPVDAQILDLVNEVALRHPRETWTGTGAVGENLRQHLGLDEHAFTVAVENLYRLRLCAPPASGFEFIDDKQARFQRAGTSLICVTEFGHAFVNACQPPSPAAPSSVPVGVATSMNPTNRIVPQ